MASADQTLMPPNQTTDSPDQTLASRDRTTASLVQTKGGRVRPLCAFAQCTSSEPTTRRRLYPAATRLKVMVPF